MPRTLDFSDGFESSTPPTAITMPTTSFTLPNNQAVATDVTGFLFTGIVHAWALVSVYRRDDAQEKAALVTFHVQYKTDLNEWLIEPEGNFDGLVGCGVTLSIVAGQVQVQTSNFAGGNYSGELQFSVLQSFEL